MPTFLLVSGLCWADGAGAIAGEDICVWGRIIGAHTGAGKCREVGIDVTFFLVVDAALDNCELIESSLIKIPLPQSSIPIK
jgi:hypothetical protein